MSSQAYVGSSKRTFAEALTHEMETNYGFLNSKRMLALLAADIQQLVEQFYPRRDYLSSGWMVFAGTQASGPKPFPGQDASAQIIVTIAWPILLPKIRSGCPPNPTPAQSAGSCCSAGLCAFWNMAGNIRKDLSFSARPTFRSCWV